MISFLLCIDKYFDDEKAKSKSTKVPNSGQKFPKSSTSNKCSALPLYYSWNFVQAQTLNRFVTIKRARSCTGFSFHGNEAFWPKVQKVASFFRMYCTNSLWEHVTMPWFSEWKFGI